MSQHADPAAATPTEETPFPFAFFDLYTFLRSFNEKGLALLDMFRTWKETGPGVRMWVTSKSRSQPLCRIVMFDIAEDAPEQAFAEHHHPGAEFFLVMHGMIVDSNGMEHGPGHLVLYPPGSTHHPRAQGRTIVIVGWGAGIEMVDTTRNN